MGHLRNLRTSETYRLKPRSLIGRMTTCDLRVQDDRVSAEHAVIHFNGHSWEVRDLASKNGTFVDGRKLAAGESVTLVERSEIAIGAREPVFVLDDATPPVPCARSQQTGEIRVATKGLLLLPDDEDPQVTIFEQQNGQWVLESHSERQAVSDRDELVVGSDRWRLELPEPHSGTLDTLRIGPTIDTIGLRFAVSRDEERIELTLIGENAEMKLAHRQYHYMLLTLARAWLADTKGTLMDRGWVDREELCRALEMDPNKLNVDVHRSRLQISAAGVHGAAGLVVRRVDTGQLRLGVNKVEIVPL